MTVTNKQLTTQIATDVSSLKEGLEGLNDTIAESVASAFAEVSAGFAKQAQARPVNLRLSGEEAKGVIHDAVQDGLREGISEAAKGIAREAGTAFNDVVTPVTDELKAFREEMAEARSDARDTALRVRAVTEGKKVVEGKEGLELADKTFMDHVKDVAPEIAIVAGGTVAGIAIYEGLRAGYDHVFGEDSSEG